MSGFGTVCLMKNEVSMLLSLGGTVLSQSQVYVDLSDCEYVRAQYTASGSMTVEIQYSLDGGSTWNTLVDNSVAFGNNPTVSPWEVIDPAAIGVGDILLQAVAYGSGLFMNVYYVDMHYR